MTDERIAIGCDALDALLGGGLERGAITQVYGPPAAGKTNIALSAAATVAAAGEHAVYIDTEGLSVDRFEQVVSPRAEATDADVDTVASRIIIEDAHDFDEQREAVRDSATFADQAGLIVLDSATGFYRLQRDDADEGSTLRALTDQITHLLSLARKNDLAVLVTNQVYADPEGDRTRALGGNTLEHWTATVLRVDRFRGGNRKATLEKHRSRPTGESATFEITDAGLSSLERGP